MIFNYKHIGLIIGMIAIIFSFLFFGRQHDTHEIILLIGIFVSTIFFLAILIGKETLKSKLLWTTITGISILFLRAIEPTIINASYRIYLSQNIDDLNAVNEILTKNSGDVSVYADTVVDKNNSLSKTNKHDLLKFRKKLDTYIIIKDDKEIYYGFWGFLDVRIGLTYFSVQPTKSETLIRVKENWYR